MPTNYKTHPEVTNKEWQTIVSNDEFERFAGFIEHEESMQIPEGLKQYGIPFHCPKSYNGR